MIEYEKIETYVLDLLSNKLAPELHYHSVDHTKYVIEKACYIAKKEGVSSSQILLIKIAALFHDIGFVKQRQDHETISCKMMRRKLKDQLSTKQLDEVCGMIMATKIPQQPTNLNEKIIADADLEYLSTKRFKEIGNLLYLELKAFDPSMSMKKWNALQVRFIGDHQYHTSYCKRYKEFRKRRNLDRLKEEINFKG